MRKLILMFGLAVVAIACATGADMMGEILDSGVPDAGADPGDGSGMRYVGHSTRTYLGTDTIDNGQVVQGIYTYYAACQETFGPGHRMCTEDEIIFTTKIPQLNFGFAWHDPRAKCNSQTGQRVAVNRLGQFSLQGCGEGEKELPIACCGPK